LTTSTPKKRKRGKEKRKLCKHTDKEGKPCTKRAVGKMDYCTSHSQVCDADGYAAYRARITRIKCGHVDDEGKPCTKVAGHKMGYCASHAQVCDPEAYAAYRAARIKCRHVDAKGRPCTKNAKWKMDYCFSHSQVCDPDGYAAYRAHIKCGHVDDEGVQCTKVALSKMDYCVSHSQELDAEGYATYRARRKCKHDAISRCGTTANRDLDGFCSNCFGQLFPADARVRYLRYKESAVVRFVSETFPSVAWRFNRQIPGGDSRRRPDAFTHLGTHALTIEVDEFAHSERECVCEHRKMMEHFVDAKDVPHVFIRFNPDGYTDHGGISVASCWGKTPKTREPRIAPKQKHQWALRLEKLRVTVEHYLQSVPDKEMSLVELFY
jgi:uncharacterized protein (DUF1330 family)